MEKIVIGKIVKPQGIKGELKVLSLADTPEIFNVINSVFIDEEEYKILSLRIADGVYLALKGIPDRNVAETFRNKLVYALKSDVPIEEDRYFVTDIIGCTVVFEDGKVLGRVEDLTTRGATDFFTVKTTEGKIVYFPFLKTLVNNVNLKENRITILSARFKEVSLYED